MCMQIRLHAEPMNAAEPSNFVEVLDSMTNLGPIIDFVVVDLERQGQGQVTGACIHSSEWTLCSLCRTRP